MSQVIYKKELVLVTLERVINYKTKHNETFDEQFKLSIPEIVYLLTKYALSFLNFIKNYQTESL